jgi:1-acyl-sn-glycerol-3-phosphate acyltransferase
MKHDSRPLQISQFLTLLAIGLKYGTYRRIGGWIDHEEGIMEQRAATLMCRRILERYGLTVEVEGAEHLEGIERRYCIASNHLSYLDWVLHLAHFPTAPAFIAKKEVTHYPVIGPYLRSRGVLIDRKAAIGARQAISAAAEADERWPILIFPEGTRSPDGEMKPFRRGGLTVISATGMPIVPTVLVGSHEAYPKGARTMRPNRRMKLIILEPVDPTTFDDPGALVEHLETVIKTEYDRRRPEILEAGERKALEADSAKPAEVPDSAKPADA